MPSTVRPGVTAGVAVTAAAIIGAAPPVAPSPDIAMRAVELVVNPVDPYVDLVTNTFDNLGTIGTHWLEDPLPTLTQLIVNWLEYLQETIDSFGDAGRAFVDGVVNLPDQLQTLFNAVEEGDIEEVLAQLVIIVLSIDPIPALVDRLLAIPYDIAGNFVSAVLATVHALQVPVGLAALDSVHATIAEAELVAHDYIDHLQTGDFAAALNQAIEAPAQILNATLNSDAPGLAGLLTPFQDLNQTGFVDAIVNYLPRTVAHAIGALDAPINDDPSAATSGADVLGDAIVGDLNAPLDPTADAAMLADTAP
jgi:hypothetical protein